MVASLVHPPPSSFTRYSMDQVCQYRLPDPSKNCIIGVSVLIQNKGCNSRVYMIPHGVVSHRHVLRPVAASGALELGDTQKENQYSPTVMGPRTSEGLKKWIDDSGNPPRHTTDLEAQLQDLFNEVKSMIASGNESDAISLLQANYEAVKEQMDSGARGIEEASIIDVIALGYLAVGNLEMVSSLLDTLNEVVDSLKNEEPLLDSILTHMGSMYSTLGKFEKSMQAYRRSLQILEEEYGETSPVLVTVLLGMAKALGSFRRATKAVEMYRRVITILEKSKGAENEDLVVPLLGIGNILMKEGRAVDAENPFNRILEIYMKLYGEKDERVAMAMTSLVRVKCAKGNADEAIDLYRRSLQILKGLRSTPSDDKMIEKMQIDLAELLHIAGRGKEACKLLEECLLVTERDKGKDHPSLVTHLVNLATSYSYSQNFVEAERLLRRSLQIMTKTVGPDDQSISFPMLHLAVTLHKLKQYEEAEQLAIEVLRIREKAFGTESLPVGEALDCLVSIQTKLGRDDTQLLEHLKMVLAIQEREFGHESAELIPTLNKVVFYLEKLGRKNEKFPLKRRLNVLRTKFRDMVPY